MISSIHIQGFRAFNDLSLTNFKRINLFLGKNDCGKTTILEALFLIIGISNPKLAFNINAFRDLFLTENEDFRFLFNRLDFHTKVSIEAIMEDGQSRSLTFEPGYMSGFTTDISLNQKAAFSGAISKESEKIEKLICNIAIKNLKSGKSKKYQSEIAIVGNRLEEKLPDKYKENLTGFFIRSNTIFTDISLRLENILIKKQKELLIEPLRLIEPQIIDLELGRNGMIYVDLGYDRLIPINLLGDGFRRIFAILTKLIDTKNGIILIDEIENGLHYTSLNTFLKYLLQISRLNNVQLFITTHSKETLQTLKDILQLEAFSSYQIEVNNYTIRNLNHNKINSYLYDYDKFEFAIEQDIELR
jgi:AAA15 family ATPase/GTPase